MFAAMKTEPEWLDTGLPDDLEQLRGTLNRRVIGQEEAIGQVVRALARYQAGLAGIDRPVAAFLLLGPTGVGKTLTVEAVAEALHGSPNAVLKIHCAELRSDHELARMKGSPPGYVGWKECVPFFHETKLREVRLRSELALVLFDEVEKAHPALWDLLLGMLDKGEVVLNDNTRTDFRKTLVFLTGNAGAREMSAQLSGGLGFQPHTRGDLAGIACRAADRLFSPEFRNRLTATLTYQSLGWTELLEVCRIELKRLAARLRARESDPIGVRFQSAAIESIARDGYEPKFGARHVKRAIERLVEDPLANMLAAGRVAAGDCVLVCRADAAGPDQPIRFCKGQ
jgi:ATP-dependent Clp protease ATP-binding subunit ClpB